jgi:hypothetical protein
LGRLPKTFFPGTGLFCSPKAEIARTGLFLAKNYSTSLTAKNNLENKKTHSSLTNRQNKNNYSTPESKKNIQALPTPKLKKL